ncbi:MAG: outer rane biosis protein [Verrucomicrobiales bacterium]|nr:outer rane biosis protein [Verrucomicrobiales bacterium]
MRVLFSVKLLSFFALTLSIRAAEWPQFRGPNHDSTTSEKISAKWPAQGPKLLWKIPVSGGFGSIAVSKGKAYTLTLRELDGVAHEVCLALDANSGKELWAAQLTVANYLEKNQTGQANSGAPDNTGGDGPRSTPSVDGDRVYVLTGTLVLYCLDAQNGKMIWRKDLVREHHGRNISWSNAASPLIDGDLVFVAGGGEGEALLAFNKKTGAVVWKGEDDTMTHSTPALATIHGVLQVIFFTQKGLASLETKSGKVLWRFPFRFSTSTAMTPVVAGNIVYCSAGYGVGSSAAKITKSGDAFTATELWNKSAKEFNNHWSTPLFKDGYLYGLFGFKEYGKCPLKCIEVATGEVKWSKEGFGPGGTILAGDKLVVLGDAGQIVIAVPTPKAYTELARANVLKGKCWSTPVVADGRIYARSAKEVVALDVKP